MPNQKIVLMPLLFLLARTMGLANASGIDPQNDERQCAADPRDAGAAVGY
jgi:hypothetical protein